MVRIVHKGEKGARPTCDLCCEKCADGKGLLKLRETSHSRHGHKTNYTCSECGVALCTKPRFVYRGLVGSCFQLFHELEDVDPRSINLCALATPQEAGYVPTSQADPTRIKNTQKKGVPESFEPPNNKGQLKKRNRRMVPLPTSPPTTGAPAMKQQRRK